MISQTNCHDNPQFVNINIDERNYDNELNLKTDENSNDNKEDSSNNYIRKYKCKIDSNNNMIIDANTLKPDLGKSILVNLNNNQGTVDHINHVNLMNQDSYRKYNDLIKNQVEGSSQISRF